MVIFIVGAHGFIGRRVAAALLEQGHEVIGAVRRTCADRARYREHVIAFDADDEPRKWRAVLAGVDVVINAAGIVRDGARTGFHAVHATGPQALFRACAQLGVRRVVQISALGADENAISAFHRSKFAADATLLSLPLDAVVAQPSLVFGANGVSARWFMTLASLPIIPLPGRGDQRVQPIHVDDLVAAIVALTSPGAARGRIALVGPRALTLREYLSQLRSLLHLGKPRFLPIPLAMARLAAAWARWLPRAMLTPETLGMLLRGNTADAGATSQLLGRQPRPVAAFVPPDCVAGFSSQARLGWLLPLLRWSIAAVWIGAGLVSFGLFPVEESYRLLARAGIPAPLQPWALYGAAALDLVIGLSLLTPPKRWLWQLQAAVILTYTAVISWQLPEFWLHPFGPVVKNLPLLAAIYLLYELSRRDGISDR